MVQQHRKKDNVKILTGMYSLSSVKMTIFFASYAMVLFCFLTSNYMYVCIILPPGDQMLNTHSLNSLNHDKQTLSTLRNLNIKSNIVKCGGIKKKR